MGDNKIKCRGNINTHFKRNISIILISFIITCTFNGSSVAAASNEGFDSQYIDSIVDLIKSKYMGDVDNHELLQGALKGLFGTMDPYTGYFTEDEAEDFFGSVEGSYEGIGVSIEKKADTVILSKVFTGSPAEQAGLIQGDKIITIDNKNVIGVSTEEASSLIRGQTGTKVILGVMRNGNSNIINVEVERKKIKINPVIYEIIDNIGYIKLEMFNANTEEFLNKALADIDKKGISKIVLDLRDNPGGLVDQGVNLARKFVPKGLITKLIFKSDDTLDQEYKSFLLKPKYDLVVLVNGMSASASEIVAGAIQDTKAGILVGTKTFGKAKVQSMLPILTPEAYNKYLVKTGSNIVSAYDLISKHKINPLNNEILGWTKITTGVYTTPNGRMIDNEGITPDIVIDNPPIINDVYLNGIQKLTVTWKPMIEDEGVDVYNAKKILKILDYSIDKLDSYLDEKTESEISRFRIDQGFFPGGVLDFTTQKALNKEYERILYEYDKQYAKALELLK